MEEPDITRDDIRDPDPERAMRLAGLRKALVGLTMEAVREHQEMEREAMMRLSLGMKR